MAETRHEWFLNQIFPHRTALARYLRKLTSDTENIEDLIQETYQRVHLLPAYDQVNSPRALLFRTAHSLCIERARRRKTQATDSRGDVGEINVYCFEAPADFQLDERRRFESFDAAVDQLPPQCRRVFVLRKVYRLSHDEIAEVLCVSHGTIEKQVAEGLLRCRDHLTRARRCHPAGCATAEISNEQGRQAPHAGRDRRGSRRVGLAH